MCPRPRLRMISPEAIPRRPRVVDHPAGRRCPPTSVRAGARQCPHASLANGTIMPSVCGKLLAWLLLRQPGCTQRECTHEDARQHYELSISVVLACKAPFLKSYPTTSHRPFVLSRRERQAGRHGSAAMPTSVVRWWYCQLGTYSRAAYAIDDIHSPNAFLVRRLHPRFERNPVEDATSTDAPRSLPIDAELDSGVHRPREAKLVEAARSAAFRFHLASTRVACDRVGVPASRDNLAEKTSRQPLHGVKRLRSNWPRKIDHEVFSTVIFLERTSPDCESSSTFVHHLLEAVHRSPAPAPHATGLARYRSICLSSATAFASSRSVSWGERRQGL